MNTYVFSYLTRSASVAAARKQVCKQSCYTCIVQFLFYHHDILLRHVVKIGSLGQVLPGQPIHILVGSAVAGTVWTGEVELYIQLLCAFFMRAV